MRVRYLQHLDQPHGAIIQKVIVIQIEIRKRAIRTEHVCQRHCAAIADEVLS